MIELSFRSPPNLAILPGASTPIPDNVETGAIAFSTTANALVYYDTNAGLWFLLASQFNITSFTAKASISNGDEFGLWDVTNIGYRKTTWNDMINSMALRFARITTTNNTGSLVTPNGTTGQRDVSPVNGYFRYNTTLKVLELYNTAFGWQSIITTSTQGHLQQIDLDFGSTPVSFGTGTFLVSSLVDSTLLDVNKPVVMSQVVGVYSGKGTLTDEIEFDKIQIYARAISSGATVEYTWESLTGPVMGVFSFSLFQHY